MPKFKIIKNDEHVGDFNNEGQIEVINKVAEKLESVMNDEVWHFESSHGHIVVFNLNSVAEKTRNICEFLSFKFLAELEENPWVRYIRITKSSEIQIYIKSF